MSSEKGHKFRKQPPVAGSGSFLGWVTSMKLPQKFSYNLHSKWQSPGSKHHVPYETSRAQITKSWLFNHAFSFIMARNLLFNISLKRALKQIWLTSTINRDHSKNVVQHQWWTSPGTWCLDPEDCHLWYNSLLRWLFSSHMVTVQENQQIQMQTKWKLVVLADLLVW